MFNMYAKVKVVYYGLGRCKPTHFNQIGKITNMMEPCDYKPNLYEGRISVKFDDGKYEWFENSQLELVNQ